MYKYNCRKCPIRNRCIDESANSPSVKQMLRHAFEARTDTLKAWDRLQRSCLLVKAEEERAKKAAEGSLLSRRLRKARETNELAKKASKKISRPPDYLRPVSQQAKSSAQPKLKSLPSSTRPKLRSLSSPSESDSLSAPQTETNSRSSTRSPEGQFAADDSPPDVIDDVAASVPEQVSHRFRKSEAVRPHWLTVGSSGRHIVLPADGELVLGRFDPNIGIPPDVDFSYEDRGANSVSRRHVKIVGVNGHHTLEDLGSSQGVFINGKRVESGLRRLLESGDRIKLGQTPLLYEAIPTHMLLISPDDQVRHSITVTPTGRRLTIAPPDDVTIGRVDAFFNSSPDIDLSQDGEVAARVSRHHAVITWRNQLPYLEDLGSGFGTRLNGKTLLLGQAVQLKPGDHIWLGGCVLAYDVEL